MIRINEITICKKLFDAMKLKNAVITANAMMCRAYFSKKIAKGNGYFITMLTDVEKFTETIRSY